MALAFGSGSTDRGFSMRLLLLVLLGLASLSAESLVTARNLSDGTLYSDQVARKVGDLISIVVSESTAATEKHETGLKRENDASAAIKMVSNSTRVEATPGAAVPTLPGFDLGSSKEFKGTGDYKATGSVTAKITGRVVDVLENGNLVIEGRREIKLNNDTKTILVTGICRTADISAGNEVKSERLHDFRVGILTDGPIARSQKEGFLGQILDAIWPF